MGKEFYIAENSDLINVHTYSNRSIDCVTRATEELEKLALNVNGMKVFTTKSEFVSWNRDDVKREITEFIRGQ